MTEGERIDFLIRALENGNTHAFARKVEVSPAHLFKLRKGQVGIRLQIPHICKAYPQVNRQWLETGEGYPGDLSVELVKTHYEEKIKRLEMIIDHLIGKDK